jgi:hypothetical protein
LIEALGSGSMTTTAAVQAEIERFLRSTEPEVLCVTGDWGVGKTFNWQTKLDQLRTAKQVGLGRYSYVSLFGINSLEAFKQSLFENLKFILPAGEAAFDRMLNGGNQLFRQGKKLVGALSAVPMVGDALTKVSSPFLFSSIRNQIVCVDDLERRGKDLSVKDVFGLISFLREQRGCKIVLLLNRAKFEPGSAEAKEFDDYFEKVIDAQVVFVPSESEAAAIAFRGTDPVSQLMAEYTVKLGVKNIRVLKKIERLILIVLTALKDPRPELVRQVVHTLVIFGWSKFDSGAKPPSMQFLKEGGILRTARDEPSTPEQERWDAIRVGYDFGYLDDFDRALFQFVEEGVLDEEKLVAEANKQTKLLERRDQAGSYEQGWRLLHDSFDDNADAVRAAILGGFERNIDVLAVRNLGEVAEFFSGLGDSASETRAIDFAEQHAPVPFWLQEDPWNRVIPNARINAIADQKRAAAKPTFDFERDLVEAAKTYDAEKLAWLAQQPPEAFLQLFESKTAEDLRRVILSALDYRKIANASDDMRAVVASAESALRTIGQRSALNAFRVKKYGV